MHGLISEALLLVQTRTTKTDYSYYISDAIPAYALGKSSGLDEKTGTAGSFTPYYYNSADQTNVNAVLTPFISPVLNLTSSFVPISFTAASSTAADIVLFGVNKILYGADQKAALARAYFSLETVALSMDIAFLSGSVGSSGVAHSTLAHELLHSLGLTDAKNVAIDPSRNDQRFTLMSYNQHPGEVRQINQPQLYDVAALQSIFGRNSGLNPANTSYTNFTSTDQDSVGQDAISTIWDSNGSDTISATAVDNIGRSAFIDLRPGYFSSIGPRNNVVVTTGASPALTNPGWLNISIAFGTSIENAIGGQASDYIIGNILTNTLSGGADDDVLYAEEVVTNYDPASRITGASRIRGATRSAPSPRSRRSSRTPPRNAMRSTAMPETITSRAAEEATSFMVVRDQRRPVSNRRSSPMAPTSPTTLRSACSMPPRGSP
jgi:hypothetical protein